MIYSWRVLHAVEEGVQHAIGEGKDVSRCGLDPWYFPKDKDKWKINPERRKCKQCTYLLAHDEIK